MILPSKHVRPERSLLGIGAGVLELLDEDRTVSSLWELLKRRRDQLGQPAVSFDWFVLTLDFLFAAGAIELREGHVRRTKP